MPKMPKIDKNTHDTWRTATRRAVPAIDLCRAPIGSSQKIE